MLRVLLAGGGTAGHVNPALAIAEIIRSHHPDAEFAFAGNPEKLEAKLVPQAGYKFYPIMVEGFQRRITGENIKRNIHAAACLIKTGSRSREIINDFKPDLVIGTGGYVAGPVVRQAAKMGIKTAIHEQNAYPGVTNKLLSKYVDVSMLTVEEAKKYLDPKIKYTVTGLPVRSGFSKITKAEARRELGFDDDTVCILSTGGSLGAGAINSTVLDLIAWYKESGMKVNHIHSYGGNGRETGFEKCLAEKGIELEGNKHLVIKEYISNMPTCMAAADLVISRCGANALTELEAMGRGSILVPSPIVAGNHQYHNGMVLQNAGAAIVIEQKDLTSQWLIDTVKGLLEDRERLASLSENAAKLYISDTNDRIYNALSPLIKDKV
ncbi:MAG: undecaprenyldiphospho-muramoylpentapeptide beta-N-acetylglucosaminyltransferase [Ruminococcus sp.]|nr:undecaprenyldiphospho-muramoylpentapeptide beta-N-acetylglucosaminyltransferase [Ruminococcus sp.]